MYISFNYVVLIINEKNLQTEQWLCCSIMYNCVSAYTYLFTLLLLTGCLSVVAEDS